MNLIETTLGVIYLVAMHKKTIKEACQVSGEFLKSALVAEKLNPTSIYFGIAKNFFEIMINPSQSSIKNLI